MPPLGPLFWQQRETRLMARNLGYKTSLSDGKLTISVESSHSARQKNQGKEMAWRGRTSKSWIFMMKSHHGLMVYHHFQTCSM